MKGVLMTKMVQELNLNNLTPEIDLSDMRIITAEINRISQERVRSTSTKQVLREPSRISACSRICRFLTMLRSDFTIIILILH